MIGYYKYSREKIAEIIKKSPKTKDGFYFVKKFPELNNKPSQLDGEKDTEYYYKRSYFENKYVFDNFELECYLSKEKKNLDVDRMINCDNQLADIIFDFLDYKLNQKIDGFSYNLNELIDTTIYFYNIKNPLN